MENQTINDRWRVVKLDLSEMLLTAQFSEMSKTELKKFKSECEKEYFFANLIINMKLWKN